MDPPRWIRAERQGLRQRFSRRRTWPYYDQDAPRTRTGIDEWVQIHLSTAVVLTVCGGVMLGRIIRNLRVVTHYEKSVMTLLFLKSADDGLKWHYATYKKLPRELLKAPAGLYYGSSTDAWDNAHAYVPSDNGKFKLWSRGANGKDNDDDHLPLIEVRDDIFPSMDNSDLVPFFYIPDHVWLCLYFDAFLSLVVLHC